MASVDDFLWGEYRPPGDVDYTYKILMVGESGVGKSAIVRRYTKDTFEEKAGPSLGVDLEVTTLNRKGKRLRLQIWDTAGQEKYRSVTVGFYRGGMGFMLVYDVTNEKSFLRVRDWLTQIRMYAWESARVVLVGNKTDLNARRVITKEMGKELGNQLGLDFVETSAKDNMHITAAFIHLVNLICEKMEASAEQDSEGEDSVECDIYSMKAVDVNSKCVC